MGSKRSMFPLRLPEGLRSRADARARELGLSLNALVAVALDQYLSAGAVRVRSRKAIARPARSADGISRNAPCWCGSGKKFKRCHGA